MRAIEQSYNTDLTPEQWEWLEPLIPPAKSGGRPRTKNMQAVMNAIFYVVVTGCQWRQMPHDFPCWSTRHLLVDTLGLVLMVIVTAANVSDQRGAKILLWKTKHLGSSVSRLVRFWADGAYNGQAFKRWVMDRFRWIWEVILRSDNLSGFRVVPKRWVVERTFGWLLWSRRLNKDYEVLPRTAEAFVYVAMIRIMLQRLSATY